MIDNGLVLVIVDPTASSHPAIERAAAVAARTKARLELFICDYRPHLAAAGLGTPEGLERARAALLDEHRRRLEELAGPLAATGLTVTVDTRWDYPLHDGIVRKARDAGAALVVKDTHYHSVLRRSIFSNTDWSLIRNCPAPLWLVKPRALAASPRLIAAVDPVHERDKPASLDHRILETALELKAALGGQLDVFHAFDIAAAIAVSSDSMTMPIALPVREFTDAMRTQHTTAVHELCAAHGIPAERAHVHQGGTRELLIALTERLAADIVVMGAVSRSGFAGLFIGNTAEDVLDRLPCDLLIVKPEGFAAELPS